MERKRCNWVKDDEGQSQKGHKRDKEKRLERCFCSKLVNVSVKNQRLCHMWFHIARDPHLKEGNV